MPFYQEIDITPDIPVESKDSQLKKVIVLMNVHIFISFMNWMITLSVFPGVILTPKFLYRSH
jgi:hypothetical protein